MTSITDLTSSDPFIDPLDTQMYKLIGDEAQRQFTGMELIASENFVSKAVRDALGSHLTNKYSEGQPGKRYYGGNNIIDKIELLCQSRALSIFNLDPTKWSVNVQSLSGSPANFQVMVAILQPNDRIMGLDLPSGGHLSHGYQTETKKISAPAMFYQSFGYKTNNLTGLLDYDELAKQVAFVRPKLLICGGSAYVRDWDYKRFREIADSVGAYLLADIAHISGLVLTKEHNNPFQYCHFVTTTTHKTLRGPRGALIFCLNEYFDKINAAVFPGCQGGPHNNVIGGIAIALHEASLPTFHNYIIQVKCNAKTLADGLMKLGYKLMTDGTDNHMILWDLRPQNLSGSKMEKICDLCHISINKNTLPGDVSALSPGGVRVGTPAMTTRGFKEKDFEELVLIFDQIVKLALTAQNSIQSKKLIDFCQLLDNEPYKSEIDSIATKVTNKVIAFPLPDLIHL